MNKRIHGGALVGELAEVPEVAAKAFGLDELKRFAKSVLSIIQEGLLRDGLVRIHEFGTFRLKVSKARQGRNPRTGEPLLIPSKARVVFTPAKALRDLVDPRHGTLLHLPTATEAAQTLPPQTSKTEPLYEVPTLDDRIPSTASIAPDPVATIEQTDSQNEMRAEKPLLAAAMLLLALIVGYVLSMPDPMQIPVKASEVPLVAKAEVQKAVATAPTPTAAKPVTNAIAQIPTPDPIASQEKVMAQPGREDIQQQIADMRSQISAVREELSSETAVQGEVAVVAPKEPAVPADLVVEQSPKTQNIVTQSPVQPIEIKTPEPFFAALDYKLVNGDSLWRLSRRNYQEAIIWPHIFNANSHKIKNPNLVRAGRWLRLPALDGSPTDLSATDRRSIAEGYYLVYKYLLSIDHHETPFALFAVAHFDTSVLVEHRDEIEREYPATLKITQLYPSRLKGRPTGATGTGIPTFD